MAVFRFARWALLLLLASSVANAYIIGNSRGSPNEKPMGSPAEAMKTSTTGLVTTTTIPEEVKPTTTDGDKNDINHVRFEDPVTIAFLIVAAIFMFGSLLCLKYAPYVSMGYGIQMVRTIPGKVMLQFVFTVLVALGLPMLISSRPTLTPEQASISDYVPAPSISENWIYIPIFSIAALFIMATLVCWFVNARCTPYEQQKFFGVHPHERKYTAVLLEEQRQRVAAEHAERQHAARLSKQQRQRESLAMKINTEKGEQQDPELKSPPKHAEPEEKDMGSRLELE